ncbi:GAF domain-containing protein [Acholeplasma granularum]|uniref:GAF domain-containing protein n=1 Tax=Acholeplasma granularum TaxID=264635 RepID=UPI00046F4110|nr:GAF domain-containing protein [Acholeplasma granularum]
MNYDILIESANALLKDEPNNLSLLSNATAFINDHINDLNWVGFYLYNNGVLTLGPFQGKVACNKILPGKGVVGTSYVNNEVIVVKNVHEIENHIMCDANSMSEVVIPIRNGKEIYAIFDFDSPIENRFDDKLVQFLRQFAALIEKYIDFNAPLI